MLSATARASDPTVVTLSSASIAFPTLVFGHRAHSARYLQTVFQPVTILRIPSATFSRSRALGTAPAGWPGCGVGPCGGAPEPGAVAVTASAGSILNSYVLSTHPP